MTISPPSFGAYLRHLRSGRPPAAFAPAPAMRAARPARNRAELATGAGTSVGYVQKLEQGHANSPSAEVVDRLAEALAITPVERQHLHDLAAAPPRAEDGQQSRYVTAVQKEAADGLGSTLAAYVDEAWNTVYANHEYARIFRHITSVGNVLSWFFMIPESKAVMLEWEPEARLTVAWLRTLMARRPGSAMFAEILSVLERSPDFVRMWELNEVIMERHKPHFRAYDLDRGREVELLAQVYPTPDPGQALQLYLGIPSSS